MSKTLLKSLEEFFDSFLIFKWRVWSKSTLKTDKNALKTKWVNHGLLRKLSFWVSCVKIRAKIVKKGHFPGLKLPEFIKKNYQDVLEG